MPCKVQFAILFLKLFQSVTNLVATATPNNRVTMPEFDWITKKNKLVRKI